jgi:hypothetical protein
MSAAMLQELAAARGLSRLAQLFGRGDVAELVATAAEADAGLTAAPELELTQRLGLLARRGLERALVTSFLESLETYVERGLAAWDVLAGSLVDDRDFEATLRSLLADVRELLPPPGARGINVDRVPADLRLPSVASAPARLLDLAHLPTLASLWLARAEDDDESRGALAEVLLDAGAADRLAPPGAKLAPYAMARAAIARGDASSAYALVQTTVAPKSDDAALQLVRAELGLRTGERPISPARIEQIVQSAPTWRYAARVRACTAAAICAPDSSSPIRLLDEYLATFGNDEAIWLGLVEYGPFGAAWFAPMMARLTREALALPHEPAVWTALATIVGGDDAPAAVAEIRQRLAAQGA